MTKALSIPDMSALHVQHESTAIPDLSALHVQHESTAKALSAAHTLAWCKVMNLWLVLGLAIERKTSYVMITSQVFRALCAAVTTLALQELDHVHLPVDACCINGLLTSVILCLDVSASFQK